MMFVVFSGREVAGGGSVHKVHRVATAAFWRTFSDGGKMSPGWWGWGVHAHPLSLHLSLPVKLQCTLHMSGQTHQPCFISRKICTLWFRHWSGNSYRQGLYVMFMVMLGSTSGNSLLVGTVTGSFMNWPSRRNLAQMTRLLSGDSSSPSLKTMRRWVLWHWSCWLLASGRLLCWCRCSGLAISSKRRAFRSTVITMFHIYYFLWIHVKVRTSSAAECQHWSAALLTCENAA